MRSNWRTSTIAAGALAATLAWAGCRDISGPVSANPGDPAFHEGGEDAQPANFRLTGGGRTDQRDHAGFAKNTPDSRDFATFGFQARPIGPNTTEGSGNITWVEHNPESEGGGFTFHGRVTFFSTATDPADDDCGRFGGFGSGRRRDGFTFEEFPFTVTHACDEGEPGVGRDHIRFETLGYARHGLLSGGNIQMHRR